MKGKQKSKVDTVIIVPALLLFVCFTVMCVNLVRMHLNAEAPVYVALPDNYSETVLTGGILNAEAVEMANTAGRQAQALNLYSRNPEENVPFQMTNMFPGDSKTQYYRVSVSYTGSVTVSFQASAGEGGEKLGEVLRARVRLLNTDEVIYEGMLADMVKLDHVLTTDSETQTEELYYEITVGLSTDVGNEYQNKSLVADLHWWAEGTEGPKEPPQTDEDDTTDDDETTDTPGGSLVDSPKTGDESRIMMYLVYITTALTVLIPVLMNYQRERRRAFCMAMPGIEETEQSGHSGQSGQGKTGKRWRRLMRGIFLVMLLGFGFGITTMALTYHRVSVEENVFETGNVNISLNDGVPVFNEDMLFEPGMVVQKDFTLRNDSSCDVYYRLYFSEVEGEFAESLEVTVTDGESAIFRGVLADMTGKTAQGADGLLREGEEHKMTITFHFPEHCGNNMQNQTVLFDLNADAVQAVNNPSQLFE